MLFVSQFFLLKLMHLNNRLNVIKFYHLVSRLTQYSIVTKYKREKISETFYAHTPTHPINHVHSRQVGSRYCVYYINRHKIPLLLHKKDVRF